MNATSLNQSPHYNMALAFDMKLTVPDIRHLDSMPEEQYFEIAFDPDWEVRLPVAIKRISGHRVNAHAFWDGQFSLFTVSFWSHHMLTGDQGPRVEPDIITMFPGSLKCLDKSWARLAERLANADYRGWVTIELTISPDREYYHDIIFGATKGWLATFEALMGTDFDTALAQKDAAPNRFASSLQLRGFPYPGDNMEEVAEAVFRNEVDVANLGTHFLVCRAGDTIKSTWKAIYRDVTGLDALGVCFRTDGGEAAKRAYNELKRRRFL